MSVSRSRSAAGVARHDVPLIRERAATGRIATDDGDERAGVKSVLSVPAPTSRTESDAALSTCWWPRGARPGGSAYDGIRHRRLFPAPCFMPHIAAEGGRMAIEGGVSVAASRTESAAARSRVGGRGERLAAASTLVFGTEAAFGRPRFMPHIAAKGKTGSTREQFLKGFAAKRAAEGVKPRETKPLPDKDVAALSAPEAEAAGRESRPPGTIREPGRARTRRRGPRPV